MTGNNYGSAQPASMAALKAAGIIGGNHGALFGYVSGRPARFPSDGGLGFFGGARSNKSSSIFAANELTNYLRCNSITFDPRGELAAISTLAASLQRFPQWTWNPFGVAGVPQHRTNPLDHLRRDSATLIADTRKTIGDLLPSTDGAKWWQDDGHTWLANLCLTLVDRDGGVTFPALYEAVSSIAGDHGAWCALVETMQASGRLEVRQTVTTIMQAQEDGREGFRAPYQAMTNALAFCQEPHIAAALEASDFSLSAVCDPAPVKVKIIMPMQYLEMARGLMRVILGRPIQDKMKRGGASRVAVLIDECGQLGHFPSVRDLYTFGGGVGLIGLCAWQEYAQLKNAFGDDGAAEIFGSMPVRVFAGTRTIETARIVSGLAGMTTLHYDDPHRQADARHRMNEAQSDLLNGGDPLDALHRLHHFQDAAGRQSQQSRSLFTNDEVLNHKGMMAFASGMVEGVILGEWDRYFERYELGGRFLCNPYHDAEFVTLKTRFGRSKRARMLSETCPPALSGLPQYSGSGGMWQYIEGHRPAALDA